MTKKSGGNSEPGQATRFFQAIAAFRGSGRLQDYENCKKLLRCRYPDLYTDEMIQSLVRFVRV